MAKINLLSKVTKKNTSDPRRNLAKILYHTENEKDEVDRDLGAFVNNLDRFKDKKSLEQIAENK